MCSTDCVLSVQECQAFEEVLTVRCPKSRLRIKLKGKGISPAIKVTA